MLTYYTHRLITVELPVGIFKEEKKFVGGRIDEILPLSFQIRTKSKVVRIRMSYTKRRKGENNYE